MKILQNRKQIVAFYMLGFLIGILYANLVSKQYMTVSGIFNEYFLKQYASTDIILEDYVWYILGVRLLPFIVICILGCTKLRKITVVGTLAWTGFSCGMLMATSIMKLGMKGVFLCIVGITPQVFFYLLAYSILLWYFYSYPQSRWNMGKMVFVLLTFSIGIVMEGYVSPILMKLFIKTI